MKNKMLVSFARLEQTETKQIQKKKNLKQNIYYLLKGYEETY
jgi:hypothetical protein